MDQKSVVANRNRMMTELPLREGDPKGVDFDGSNAWVYILILVPPTVLSGNR